MASPTLICTFLLNFLGNGSIQDFLKHGVQWVAPPQKVDSIPAQVIPMVREVPFAAEEDWNAPTN